MSNPSDNLLWIGFVGAKGSGKTYTAHELSQHYGCKLSIYCLSSYLDYYIHEAYRYAPEDSRMLLSHEAYRQRSPMASEHYKELDVHIGIGLFRKLKQDVGAILHGRNAAVLTEHADVYVDNIASINNSLKAIIIPDLRYSSDIAWLRNKPQNMLIKIEDASLVRSDWHASEIEALGTKPDYMYVNFRTPDTHKEHFNKLIQYIGI